MRSAEPVTRRRPGPLPPAVPSSPAPSPAPSLCRVSGPAVSTQAPWTSSSRFPRHCRLPSRIFCCILWFRKKSRWECRMAQPVRKTVPWFLQRLHIDLLYDPAMPLPGVDPEEMNTGVQADPCTRMSTARLFAVAKTWKQPQIDINGGWRNRMWEIHAMDYYSAIKRNEVLTHAAMGRTLKPLCSVKEASHRRPPMVPLTGTTQKGQIH